MGTKSDPGLFDCYGNALPDEPMFILLGRDPDFYRLVTKWANKREHDIQCGERPVSDMAIVQEARECAYVGAEWRRANPGKWRSTDFTARTGGRFPHPQHPDPAIGRPR